MGSIFIPLTGVVLTSLHVMCGFVCMSNQTLSLRKEILAAQYYVKYAKLGQQATFCPKKRILMLITVSLLLSLVGCLENVSIL